MIFNEEPAEKKTAVNNDSRIGNEQEDECSELQNMSFDEVEDLERENQTKRDTKNMEVKCGREIMSSKLSMQTGNNCDNNMLSKRQSTLKKKSNKLKTTQKSNNETSTLDLPSLNEQTEHLNEEADKIMIPEISSEDVTIGKNSIPSTCTSSPGKTSNVNNSKKSFSCKYCSKKYIIKSNLINHQKIYKSFKCEYCKKMYLNKKSLNCHKKKLHFSGCECESAADLKSCQCEHNWDCSQCQINLETQRGWINHQSSVHGESLLHQCEKCGRKFPEPKLSRQLSVKYLCTYCGECCLDHTALKKHILRHTRKKTYSCKICKKSFTHIVW